MLLVRLHLLAMHNAQHLNCFVNLCFVIAFSIERQLLFLMVRIVCLVWYILIAIGVDR